MASAESAAFGASETFEQIAAHPSELLQCFRRVISASKIVFIASIDCVEWHMNVRYTFCTCPRYTARFCLILRSEPISFTVDAYTGLRGCCVVDIVGGRAFEPDKNIFFATALRAFLFVVGRND